MFKNISSMFYCWLYTFILRGARPERTVVEHVQDTSRTLKDHDPRLADEGFRAWWGTCLGFQRGNSLLQRRNVLYELCEDVVHLWRCGRRRFRAHAFRGGVQGRCRAFVKDLSGDTFHGTGTFRWEIKIRRCAALHSLRILYIYLYTHCLLYTYQLQRAY